jgi:hypothetical protein
MKRHDGQSGKTVHPRRTVIENSAAMRLSSNFLSMAKHLLFVALAISTAAWAQTNPAVETQPRSEAANQAPAERDLRSVPLDSESDIESLKKGNITPRVDQEYFRILLDRAQDEVDTHWFQWTSLKNIVSKPERPLSYHVVVRRSAAFTVFDLKKEEKITKYSYINLHYPALYGKSVFEPTFYIERNSEEFSSQMDKYLHELDIYRMAKLGALVPTDDPNRADILVHVNLSERREESEGFLNETMPRFPQRRIELSTGADMHIVEYVQPWTMVRLYFSDRGTRPGEEAPAEQLGQSYSLQGGEIWIQYPVRSFLQEELARIALDHREFSRRWGLGETRDEIVGRFRPPHRRALKPIDEIWRWRASVLFGAGGAAESSGRDAPRPKENLLTLAERANQELEGRMDGGYFPYHCSPGAFTKLLRGKVWRSLAMFTGIEAGGMLISGDDYASEVMTDPDALIADFSLGGYKESFDQRVMDQLIPLIVEERAKLLSLKEPNYSLDSKVARKILDSRGDELKKILADAALSFAPHIGGCWWPSGRDFLPK